VAFFHCEHNIWEAKTEIPFWAYDMAQKLSVKCEKPHFCSMSWLHPIKIITRLQKYFWQR